MGAQGIAAYFSADCAGSRRPVRAARGLPNSHLNAYTLRRFALIFMPASNRLDHNSSVAQATKQHQQNISRSVIKHIRSQLCILDWRQPSSWGPHIKYTTEYVQESRNILIYANIVQLVKIQKGGDTSSVIRKILVVSAAVAAPSLLFIQGQAAAGEGRCGIGV